MSAHHGRRLDFAAGNHFSFSRPVFDHLKYNAWAESIKKPQNPFGRRESDRKFGPWTHKIPHPDGVGEGDEEEDSSGTATPPLWESATPESRPKCSQMIADYRQEMMDLAHNLPETAYELSLRDIVESPTKLMRDTTAERKKGAAPALTEKVVKDKRRQGSSSRNGSVDAGGFLPMFFTPSKLEVVGGGRTEACRDSGVGWARPMAAAADGEWFNSESGERKSRNGSPNSSCDGRGRKRWKISACFAFLCRNRNSRSREL